MIRNCLVILLLMCFCHGAFSQMRKKRKSTNITEIPLFNLGVGAGLDYGGIIGTRVTVFPHSMFGVFGGLGYNLAGVGYNVGGIIRFSESRICPYVMGMYGYNAVINSTKVYYGATFGMGMEIRNSRGNRFFSAGLLLPFHSEAFQNDINAVKSSGGVFTNEAKIGISLGYHFGFEKQR
jgi:hypothetical protein